MEETSTLSDFSFEPFAKNAFYRSLNGRLVDMVPVGSGQRIVDLACGTGGVTRLILERLRGARESAVIAIDQSSTALKQAMEDLKDARDSAIDFVQSRVEHLSETLRGKVDTIIYCNAIHYVTDKDALLDQVSSSLKPGGTFAFNTSFFEGGQPPESQRFYRRWMLKAIRNLKQDYGLAPARLEKVEARRHLSAEAYRDLVESHGFKVLKQEIDPVAVPLAGWVDISTFEDFISGVMPGVPLDKASASMTKGARQAFEELGLETVPRNWLDVVAVRV